MVGHAGGEDLADLIVKRCDQDGLVLADGFPEFVFSSGFYEASRVHDWIIDCVKKLSSEVGASTSLISGSFVTRFFVGPDGFGSGARVIHPENLLCSLGF